MKITVETIRAEDVEIGMVERHVSGQGRLLPWRRVTHIVSPRDDCSEYLTLVYESGDRIGGAVRKLDLVEVQVEHQRAPAIAKDIPT
jgi:hypothetical protein